MRDKFFTTVLAALVAVLSFGATAYAAGAAAPTEGSLLDLAKPVFEAVMSGQGWLAAALALVLLVTAARRYGAVRFPFLGSKLGGVALNLLLSFGGAAATAIMAGASASFGLAFTALKVAVAAASGFELVKELIAPMLRGLVDRLHSAKLRAMLHAGLNFALWAFENRGKAAVAKAEKAGDAAVEAKPAAGAAGVVGTPTNWP